jgi:hypothetical protein
MLSIQIFHLSIRIVVSQRKYCKEIYLSINCFCDNHSEFSDIFDVKHFKRILQADVRVVSSLPSTHLMSRQSTETKIPHDVSPLWIRSRFSNQVRIIC